MPQSTSRHLKRPRVYAISGKNANYFANFLPNFALIVMVVAAAVLIEFKPPRFLAYIRDMMGQNKILAASHSVIENFSVIGIV